jgi:adenosylhomocysteine nucleosidase
MSPHRLAIVAALEREVRGLVKNWKVVTQQCEGRTFRFYESQVAVVVCGGIGVEAARRASEAVVKLYGPEVVISAGFAGALDPQLRVGQVFLPSRVIDAKDGSSTQVGSGSGVLISIASVASAEQKSKLANAYGAQAVDMEAAAVAVVSRRHELGFVAIKAISDASDFEMPSTDRFITSDGQFRTGAFAWFSAMRPWLWPRLIRLSRYSAKASDALCSELGRYIGEADRANSQELQAASRV